MVCDEVVFTVNEALELAFFIVYNLPVIAAASGNVTVAALEPV